MQPRVGDTVIIEGIVTEVNSKDHFYIKTADTEVWCGPFKPNRIKEIVRRPLHVGDTVRVVGDILPDFHYKVLAVHGSGIPLGIPPITTRRWAVIAHGDDGPCVYHVSKLECVD